MGRFLSSYRGFFTRERRRSLALALIIFALALVFQFYASSYSNRVASNFVRDMVLDNVPIVNLNGIIVEGAIVAIVLSVFLILSRPRYIIFALKAAGIFIATRAFFIAVTHLGIYPGQIGPDGNGFFDHLYTNLGLEAGYFFSSHTGLPFLMSLIFWNERVERYLFIALGCVFGISVLLAHVHYSIDVFAAPYMTYSIFKLSQYLFPQDYALIEAG